NLLVNVTAHMATYVQASYSVPRTVMDHVVFLLFVWWLLSLDACPTVHITLKRFFLFCFLVNCVREFVFDVTAPLYAGYDVCVLSLCTTTVQISNFALSNLTCYMLKYLFFQWRTPQNFVILATRMKASH